MADEVSGNRLSAWYDLFSRGARDWLRHNEKVRDAVRAQSKALRDAIAGMVAEHPGDADQRADATVDGIVGLIWCVASGVLNTGSATVLEQVRQAIELVCRQGEGSWMGSSQSTATSRREEVSDGSRAE